MAARFLRGDRDRGLSRSPSEDLSRAPLAPVPTESCADRTLLERAGTGDVAAAAELYDRYGAALYALAISVTRRHGAAEQAVVDGFRAAAGADGEPGDRGWPLLARATLSACVTPETPPAPSRCLLALTLLGDHNYREAAAILGIEPAQATRYLREALHAQAPDSSQAPLGGRELA